MQLRKTAKSEYQQESAWRHLPVMVVYLQTQPLGSNNQSRLEMQVFGYHSVKFTKLLHVRDEIS